MKSLKRLSLFTAVTLLSLYLTTPVRISAAITRVEARKPAPNFALTDATGAIVRLSDYKGQVVVLDFWATTCGGCKVEIPWFMEFKNKYKAARFAVIGVSTDDDGWKTVKPYVEQKKINYPVVVSTEDVAKLYGGVQELPMTLLIDRDGKVADTHVGMVDKNVFENEIRTLLEAR
jgi:peroxiredoxin